LPFFIWAGFLMNTMGISERIFAFADSLVGHVKGGMGHVNILASVIFAGMSGSATADAAGLGNIEIKAMLDRGYDPDFSAAITAASSCIGPIMPPSVMMVVYAVMAGVSTWSMFLAGFIPGVIMAIFLGVKVYFKAKRCDYPVSPKCSFREVLKVGRDAFFALLSPVIILGSIAGGIVTPTEAGVLSIVYALFLGVLYKTLTWKSFTDSVKDSVRTAGMIFPIVSAAAVFGWLVTASGAAMNIADLLLSITTNKTILLLLINAILLVVGMFIEAIAALMIFTPIFLPLAMKVGIDPIHLGVVMVFNLTLAINTPPVGECLYIVADMAKISLERTIKAVIPFLIPLILALLLISVFPETVLLLPRLFN
jgi:tripartite ATP-independent transporter DctM subunit